MTATTHDDPTTTTGRPVALRALQVFATLSVLDLLWQFVTAGQMFPRGGPVDLHSWGAIALHVVTGLATLAAAAHWRTARAPVWPTVLAALVFVLSFVQAYFGERSTLWIHVPLALVLSIGTVWVTAWAFTRPAGIRTR